MNIASDKNLFSNKRGQKEGSPVYVMIIGIILALLVAYALYHIIRGIGNAALPK